jgi:hypothetical protein
MRSNKGRRQNIEEETDIIMIKEKEEMAASTVGSVTSYTLLPKLAKTLLAVLKGK